MITQHKNSLTGETFFLWDRSGAEPVRLRRVSGGVGWPSKGRPGFLVVVGEESAANPDFPDMRTLHVVREAPDWLGANFLGVPSMLQAMTDIRRVDRVAEWWGEERPEFYPELRAHNRAQASRRLPPVRVLAPRDAVTPEWLAMRVHLRTSAQKTLFFHQSDATRAALSALGRDLSDVTWATAPEVTALLMAISPLETRRGEGDGPRGRWAPADGVAGY